MPRRTTMSPEFNEETLTIRGVTYRIRELSIGEYDELVKLATTEKENPVTGMTEEEVDNTILIKFMVLKCVIDPKLSAEQLASLPMRAALRLNRAVNLMHYGDEPEEKPEEAAKDATPEDEEEAKGND